MKLADQEFFTVAELAEILRVKPLTIYRMVKRGEIESHRIGRSIRFRRDDIEAFLGRCREIVGARET